MRKPSRAAIYCHATQKHWNSNVLSKQIEKPCRAETLQNVKSLEGLTSDETRTAEGFVIFSFGKWWRHMKTKNNRQKNKNIQPVSKKKKYPWIKKECMFSG